MDVSYRSLPDVPPEAIYSSIKKKFLDHTGADAIYILGSPWDTLSIVAVLEQDLGVPVVQAVAARIWEIQRRLHVRQPIKAAPTTTTAGSPGTLGSPGFAEQIGAFSRVVYQLWQDDFYSLHIGGDAEFLLRPPGTNALTLGDRPELRIDPTPILSTGAIANISHAQVYSAEGAAQFGSLFFEGEYFWYDLERVGQPSLRFNGGYVEGEWTFTGERRKYKPEIGAYHAVVPDHPFSLATHEWGAWEVAGRYSTIDLNDRFVRGIPTAVTLGAAGGEQTVYSFGLNWYPNQNVRLLFDYIYGPVNKFSGAGANPGADIGARFNAVAMRTEFYF